ncbi:MAG: SH3 domain-containing protein [Proteobacteria bacterium]|nr:SH3 domain-containing protein [Pseudomonadota bacterium]
MNTGRTLRLWAFATPKRLRPHRWAGALALLMILGAPATPDATPGQILYVKSEIANVRKAPSRKARIVKRLRHGHKVIEFERRRRWVRVGMFDTSGRVGWIHGALLGPELPGTRPPPPPPAPTRQAKGAAPEKGSAQEKGSAKQKPKDPALYTFVIDVSGLPTLKIEGRCRVVNASGVIERGTFRGWIPARFTVTGQAASCTVRKRDFSGRMVVKLLLGNRVIAARQTRAAFRWIRVRSAGPWGKAGAFRGGGIFRPVPTPSEKLKEAGARRVAF